MGLRFCMADSWVGLWSAVGLVATAVISALVFGQRLNTIGIIATGLIVVGCILLNLFGSAH